MIFEAQLFDTATSLRGGKLDVPSYISTVCDRVDAFDSQLQALLPEADRRVRLMREASALKARFPDPESRPPLYGVPVGVKDIFRVEGFLTRAGSRLPPELFAGPEAACVSKLRAAGALILGKTVSTEFAYREPGPTRNPYNLNHTPGGSSSGSAAAVAVGFCPLALGTQTVGSVIRPAAYCGIVGFKPSYGRIQTAGLIFFSESVDHVGLFTQDVAGMGLAASILCSDWTQLTEDPRSPVLGVPEGPYLKQASQEGLEAFEKQLTQLEGEGYSVRRVRALDDLTQISHHHRKMIAAEMAQVHAEWFLRHETLYRNETAALIREGKEVSAEELAEGRASRARVRNELERLMKKSGIDLWVSPSATGPAPEGLGSTGDPAMNMPWTHAGMPTITLPAGLAANGLPLGLQMVAPYKKDERLLEWAEALAKILDAQMWRNE
ncbi:amidase [bacterium]|nr:MAG: amidase [bacterium]